MPMSRLCTGMSVTSSPPTQDAAVVGRFETGDHAQGRGLAAAGRPEQREELARLD